MRMKKDESSSPPMIILDCNLWIKLLLEKMSPLRLCLIRYEFPIVLTSYMVVEILRVLKRLAVRSSTSYAEIEAKFWDFCSQSFIQKDFQQPFTETLISDVKKAPEYRIIAKLLGIEAKDVPYLVAAFQHNVILISDDVRSLISKSENLKQKLGVTLSTSVAFIGKFTKK